MDDIDVVEWNEAFAIIDALFDKSYPEHMGKYNMLGGALTYGHPYGAALGLFSSSLHGCFRICNGRYGLCAIAGAGSTGTTSIMERM